MEYIQMLTEKSVSLARFSPNSMEGYFQGSLKYRKTAVSYSGEISGCDVKMCIYLRNRTHAQRYSAQHEFLAFSFVLDRVRDKMLFLNGDVYFPIWTKNTCRNIYFCFSQSSC